MSPNCWILPLAPQCPPEMEKCLRQLQFPTSAFARGELFSWLPHPSPLPAHFGTCLTCATWHSPQPLPVSSVPQHLLSRRTLGWGPCWLCFSQLFMSHRHLLDPCHLLDGSILSSVCSMSTCNNHELHWMFYQNCNGYMTIVRGTST